jgi:hypothetical protein
MNRKAVLRAVVFTVTVVLAASVPSMADDSAASIAAGGLVPRRETRIVMAREVLQISLMKIVVDYDFRNDTGEDVTTEVAFPIPPYGYSPDSPAVSSLAFSDFRLSVGGKSVPFKAEAKAFLKGKEVTGILAQDSIDVATFGHLEEPSGASEVNLIPDLARLPQTEQKRLVALGLFEDVGAGNLFADWTVHLQYHWTQTFPAHSTVHIRHEYTPVAGDELMPRETIDLYLLPAAEQPAAKFEYPPPPDDLKLLASFCPAPSLLKGIQQKLNAGISSNGNFAYPQWVDFILTSANTWRQPIEDFTLIVERPKAEHGGKVFLCFCSPANGTVEKTDVDLFQVHLTNFIPSSELRIGFFEVPQAKASQPAAKK